MRLVLAGIAVLGFCVATQAAADTAKPQLVYALGDVLASEEYCELSYDQEAIADYVSKNVPASDMGFTDRLYTATAASKRSFNEKTISEKTAHCTQVKRVAKLNGFIK